MGSTFLCPGKAERAVLGDRQGLQTNRKGTPMSTIQATHVVNNRYLLTVGRHALNIDQPAEAGGEDSGPTPLELFAASLVSCTAHYAGSYLARHGLPTDGLLVDGEFELAEDSPPRVVRMSVTITPPDGLSTTRKAGLLAVASRCTVHNTLSQPPAVTIGLSEESISAVA
jgi:uncharacterized OsmC-like protein